MTERQATIDFTGLPQVIGGTVTWSRGISPSSIQIETVPQNNFTQPVGDVTIRWAARLPNGEPDPGDDEALTITLEDCAVETSTIELTSRQTWRMTLYDRRWRWKRGEISGKYNQTLPDGTLIVANTKTNQELAELCLDAMGETGYDTDDMPVTTYYRVEWDVTNPAEALAEVCRQCGCEVTLQTTTGNPVKIVRVTQGALLPAGPIASLSAGITIGQAPAVIRAVTEPVLMQRRLKLRAVGVDTVANDSEILPIASLSYEPTAGFQDPYYMLDVTASDEARTLALKTVYKWYQVISFADGTLDLPSIDDDDLPFSALGSAADIVLTSGMIDSTLDSTRYLPKEPLVIGNFYEGQILQANVSNTIYKKEFTIDQRRNIVQFREPVTKLNSNAYEAAELYLEIAFKMLGLSKNPLRHRREANFSGTNYSGGTHVFRVPKSRTIQMPYSDLTTEGTAIDNITSLNTELDDLIQIEEDKFEEAQADEAVYGGIVLQELDGLIQQVVWNIGRGAAATTRIGRNKIADRVGIPEKVKRDREESARAIRELYVLFKDAAIDPAFKTGYEI